VTADAERWEALVRETRAACDDVIALAHELRREDISARMLERVRRDLRQTAKDLESLVALHGAGP
jgi:hypothetical protein